MSDPRTLIIRKKIDKLLLEKSLIKKRLYAIEIKTNPRKTRQNTEEKRYILDANNRIIEIEHEILQHRNTLTKITQKQHKQSKMGLEHSPKKQQNNVPPPKDPNNAPEQKENPPFHNDDTQGATGGNSQATDDKYPNNIPKQDQKTETGTKPKPAYNPKFNYDLPTNKEQAKKQRDMRNLEDFLNESKKAYEHTQQKTPFNEQNTPKYTPQDTQYSFSFNQTRNEHPKDTNFKFEFDKEQKDDFFNNFDTPKNPRHSYFNQNKNESNPRNTHFDYNQNEQSNKNTKNLKPQNISINNENNITGQNFYEQDQDDHQNRGNRFLEYGQDDFNTPQYTNRNLNRGQNQQIRKTFMFRLKEIPKFNGENYQQLIDFIDAMDTLSSSCMNENEETELHLQMMLQLRGEARSVISNMEDQNWYNIKPKLRSHFSHLSNRNIITSQLENLRQEYNESLSEYANRARKLLRERNSTFGYLTEDQRSEHNRTARRAFSKGIKNFRLRDRLLIRGANSLEDAISYAIEAENDATYLVPNNELFCKICKTNGHREQNCGRRNPNDLNLSSLLYALNDARRPYNNRQYNNYNNPNIPRNFNNNRNYNRESYENYNRNNNRNYNRDNNENYNRNNNGNYNRNNNENYGRNNGNNRNWNDPYNNENNTQQNRSRYNQNNQRPNQNNFVSVYDDNEFTENESEN